MSESTTNPGQGVGVDPGQFDFLLARIAEDQFEAMSGGRLDVNPARLRGECAAKLGIATSYRAARDAWEQTGGSREAGELAGLGAAVAALASIYSDHEDYREEWRA